ncbi:MAG: glutathione transport system substrate-binding protein, partial [Nocardioidaceae bacterium]|nr:glutathione transport system substrate-binding protein [Nocardioidaceae bacterium]
TLRNTGWVTAAPGKVAVGGTLRLAADAIPRNFNPQQADGAMSEASTILAPTVGSAVRITADGGWQVDPDYATSIKVTSKSPLTISVHLNKHAVWQGGTPIRAKDMVAFWHAQNGSNAAFKVSSTQGFEDISTVKPEGTYAYSVIFKKPTGEWPQYVYPRLPANVSSSPKLFNAAFRKRAIPSNGPFNVSAIDARTGTVTETPNPRWWGAKPRLAKIVWRIATADVQAKAYAAHELDAVTVQAAGYPTVKGTGTLQTATGLDWTQLTLNGARGPLKDVDVRRAVAHAIDRRQIADQAAGEVGAKGTTLGSFVYLPGQRGYHDSAASIAYDPKESARLLAKAGYAKNSHGTMTRKGKALTLTMPVPAKTPTNSERAAAIKRDLKKVGVAVRLRTVPAASFFTSYVVPLNFDLVTFAWRGSAFPVAGTEPLFFPVDSGQNFTGLRDDDLGATWDKANATLDDAERHKIVRTVDARLLADVPMVPISVTPVTMAVRNGVLNYGASQFEQPDWTRVGFSPEKK